MSLHQRGVRPMRTDDHLLERIVVQLHVAGRLHNEIGRLEHGDINDVQISICRRGREEKSPLLAIVCVCSAHERGAKCLVMRLALEAEPPFLSGFRHLL